MIERSRDSHDPVRMRGIVVAGALCAAVALCAWFGVARGQTGDSRIDAAPTAEFHFARLVYRDSPASRRGRWGRGGGGAWATDYADAEFHVMQGISRLIRVDAAAERHHGRPSTRSNSTVDQSLFAVSIQKSVS
jgi:hypothetical protein